MHGAISTYLDVVLETLNCLSDDEPVVWEKHRFNDWSAIDDDTLSNKIRAFDNSMVQLVSCYSDLTEFAPEGVIRHIADSLKPLVSAQLQKELTRDSIGCKIPSVEPIKDVNSIRARVESLEQREAEIRAEAQDLSSELDQLAVPKNRESEAAALVVRLRKMLDEGTSELVTSDRDFFDMSSQQIVHWLEKEAGMSRIRISRAIGKGDTYASRVARDVVKPSEEVLFALRELAKERSME